MELKRYRPEDSIETKQGLHWYRTAGSWADKPIEPSPLWDIDGLIIKEEYIETCTVDPRKFVGTSHARYNQGMTWRQFLHGGKRIAKNLADLEKSALYYDDPIAVSGDRDTWHVVEIDGLFYASSSNHRGVIAKFRAHEDLITTQLIHSLRRYTTNKDAQAQYERLQRAYLPGQSDFGIEKKLIRDDGRTKIYESVVRCDLRLGSDPITELSLAVAASEVARHNRFYRLLHRCLPRLWNMLAGHDS